MGFFGSSCSAAITKNFGALSMSITSTARKATTLFLSFFLFDNQCTFEHITGIVVFISALTAKSLKRSGRRRSNATSAAAAASRRRKKERMLRRMPSSDLELGSGNSDGGGRGAGGMTSSSGHQIRSPPLSTTSSFGSVESVDSNRGAVGGTGSRRRVGSASASPRVTRTSRDGGRKQSPKVRYHVV